MDDNETWLKMCKITLLISDRKILTSTGSPLNDKHINLAQIMLKHQFSTLNGFVLPCYSIKVQAIKWSLEFKYSIVIITGLLLLSFILKGL